MVILKGTTIGYGDISPKTDMGKLAVALYAILAINVVASILEPAMQFLLTFCVVPTDDKTTTKAQAKKQTKQSALQQKGAQNANGEAKKKKKKKKKTS